eukprot:CCRYP_006335-RA/>CCRYP_006335-RA protein AED:0.42 eAED:0.42 QI:107/1/1/1/0/0/2/0/70
MPRLSLIVANQINLFFNVFPPDRLIRGNSKLVHRWLPPQIFSQESIFKADKFFRQLSSQPLVSLRLTLLA